MSHRVGIATAIINGLKESMDGTGTSLNALHDNVVYGGVHFQEIKQHPLVSVVPGQETRQYLPSNISEAEMILMVRIYTSGDEANLEAESIMAEIERYLDDNNDIAYVVETPEGDVDCTTIQINVVSINTGEGFIDPRAEIGEITLQIQYHKIRGYN